MSDIATRKGMKYDPEAANWRKSTLSGGPTDSNCVEFTPVQGGIALRDTEDRDGPMLFFTNAQWGAFTEGVKLDEFPVPA